MLFYLFIICQIFHSISCQISCYECPMEQNIFNYLVTPDNMPETLKGCSIKPNMAECNMNILWQQNPDMTQILLGDKDRLSRSSNNHILDVAVGFENKNSVLRWEKVLIYTCLTDQCNSFDQLKRLLASITVTEDLSSLSNIIKPEQGFQGQWCDRRSNATFQECDTTIPVANCTQCVLKGQINSMKTEVCATCLTDGREDNSLSYGVMINMDDKTRTTIWQIQCLAERCNSIENGDLILQKSQIDFDFNKYTNDGNKKTMNKLILIFLIFSIVKMLY